MTLRDHGERRWARGSTSGRWAGMMCARFAAKSLIALAVLSITLFGLVTLLERILLRWQDA